MMQMTPGLEKMILEGQAEYKTLSMAGFNEMIIPVPDKSYIVVLGYEYLPVAPLVGQQITTSSLQPIDASYFVQYLNFVSGGTFYPFQHYLFYKSRIHMVDDLNIPGYIYDRSDYDHQHRATYMVFKNDVAVYATKMNTAALIESFATLPIASPIQQILGYGGLNAIYGLQNYNDTGAGRLWPLTNKYTQPFIDPVPSRYSQAFTIPSVANSADAWIDFAAFRTGRYEKARLNHVVLHYVKINTEPPGTLI